MIFPLENNGNIKSTVLNFVSTGRLPHALLIEGESADDKNALAEFIATAAVCGKENAPCGACLNCHQASVRTHPDITRVCALEGKKNLTVDQIRKLRADAFVKPHSADRRVFIIEDAHRMNEQAQNALLKVLEEPPQNVVFILSCPSKTLLLDTIISRCVLLSLHSAAEHTTDYIETAEQFIKLLISGSEYEILKLLTPLEKNRVAAEEFLNTLSLVCARHIKKGGAYTRVLDSLFDDIKYYLELLKTNVNIPLLTSLIVSRSKSLL